MSTAYRSRCLTALTRRQIEALPDKPWAPVILPTGAIEQHGPHLPVAVDSLLGQTWALGMAERLQGQVSAYFAPAITVGKSNEHVGFPGTLMISRDSLRAQILTVAEQIAAWGFRSLLVLNTHGGNTAVILATLREIRARLALRCDLLRGAPCPDLSPQENAWGFHAGEFETSLLLAEAPHLVRMEKARLHYAGRIDAPGELRPEFAPATFAWAAQDLSPDGTLGDAPAATAEKGRRWRDAMIDAQLAFVAKWCAESKAACASTR